MRNPFITRRPWAVFLVALLLNPIVGMLYLGKARLAGVYLLTACGLLAGFMALYPSGFGNMQVIDASAVVEWFYRLLGASLAAFLARKHPFVSPGRWFSRWYAVLAVPAGYLLIVLAGTQLLFHPYTVPSSGMNPTIGTGDFVIATPRIYDSREPARGDVVAYYQPHSKATFVKRIIGVPHDRIAIRGGVVILNGKSLALNIVSPGNQIFLESLPETGRIYTIQKTLYFHGPNDEFSETTVPTGHYFVLGDNRDNSLDSRFSEVGFIARGDIIGPVAVRFFDGEERRFVWKPVR